MNNELDRRILAGHIKTVREALGETFEQFAARLGVTIPEATGYEIAIRRPGLEASTKICEAALELGKTGLAQYFEDRVNGLRHQSQAYKRFTYGGARPGDDPGGPK